MNRIQQTFARLEADKKSALIPYVTAGDPRKSLTVPLMHELVAQGADIIELGVPFSDPMADGPTIQLAFERALLHNTGLFDVLAMVKEFRLTDQTTPVVLMGYLNPVEFIGFEKVADALKDADVDGILTVDMPPEECTEFSALLAKRDIDRIFLITPTTTDERAKIICDASSGYVYYVSLKGVTGSNALDVNDVSANLDRFKDMTDLPIAVGFGIKDAVTAKAVSEIAAGVIVGSALVNTIARLENESDADIATAVGSIIGDMRQAMDQA